MCKNISPIEKHVLEWENGCGNCICETAYKKCFVDFFPYQPKHYCSILFVGEGPGISENIIGKPFVGPSGILFRKIISENLPKGKTVAFTNLVLCRPYNEKNENRQPTTNEIVTCEKRLEQTIKILKPVCVCAVGKLAFEALHESSFIKGKYFKSITHPAHICRLGGEKSVKYNEYVETISELLRIIK